MLAVGRRVSDLVEGQRRFFRNAEALAVTEHHGVRPIYFCKRAKRFLHAVLIVRAAFRKQAQALHCVRSPRQRRKYIERCAKQIRDRTGLTNALIESPGELQRGIGRCGDV